MCPPSLQQQALTHTHRLIRLACERFGILIAPPEVRFDLRGKAAGMAISPPQGSSIIRYNHTMLAENGQAFIRQTVPHEVAHLVARALHGRHIRPHGAEWRSIMVFFEADPVRCHDFTITRNNRRRMRHFPYQCACRDHRLSAIRHNRSQTGITYLCRLCGSPLRWIVVRKS